MVRGVQGPARSCGSRKRSCVCWRRRSSGCSGPTRTRRARWPWSWACSRARWRCGSRTVAPAGRPSATSPTARCSASAARTSSSRITTSTTSSRYHNPLKSTLSLTLALAVTLKSHSPFYARMHGSPVSSFRTMGRFRRFIITAKEQKLLEWLELGYHNTIT